MDEAYNYRAPQYVDFASAVHDNEDNDFFDFDMDTGAPLNNDLSPTAPSLVNEPATPYEDAEDDDNELSPNPAQSPKSEVLTSHRRTTFTRRSVFDGIEVETPLKKAHSMKTRLDSVTRTPRLELRSRSIVKAMEDSPLGVPSPVVEAQSPEDVPMFGEEEVHHCPGDEAHIIPEENPGKKPVPLPRKRKLLETTHAAYNQPPAKFISMAEHIIKLQKQTPARFRTKPRLDGVTKKTFGGPTAPKTITVPHTPALVSHLRTRPVHALTREEEELKEFEEAQKAKFKAAPLKENHFKSSRVAVVEKKRPTQVEPFHLTEYRPKPRAPDEPIVVFKARPVPKAVRSGPKVEVPQKKKKMPSPAPRPVPKSHPGPLRTRTTVVQPFSFENRGFDPKAKREKMIKEMEEQERKAKEFKARPLPPKLKAVVESMPKRVKPVEDEEAQAGAEKFKARSPTVLRKAPFVPAKSARAPLEPRPFNLHSEARMHERHKYDLVLKQKELELEEEKRRQQEEEARRTAEEVAQLRRQTVHHAKPVPHFRPFQVKPSHAPLTNPHSPNFMKRLRSQKADTTEKLNTTFDIENP